MPSLLGFLRGPLCSCSEMQPAGMRQFMVLMMSWFTAGGGGVWEHVA